MVYGIFVRMLLPEASTKKIYVEKPPTTPQTRPV